MAACALRGEERLAARRIAALYEPARPAPSRHQRGGERDESDGPGPQGYAEGWLEEPICSTASSRVG